MSLIGEKTRKNDVFELRLTFRFDNLRGAAQMQRHTAPWRLDLPESPPNQSCSCALQPCWLGSQSNGSLCR
jgi:hypothetical protein